ncbi:NADPH-dependent aldo-keto reductase, chloroplastic-like [Juglans microcarpa x Juglans regia]|uniref:NADPH-dependent aldo-keto reductase, chloroplastic-like n=1 Tax=Juglans microcarpa x Juglans regia TaxID=2249226 RepID=UPI001B7F6AAD|nr:NADPH-dependent aldo-keto reductase, chloroplastic-like [Juglans microcarpa x Juglans regia]
MRSNEVRLNCGITMPVIGLGTYSSENDRETTELAIHMALKMGYRHFDTAKIYGSEPAVGNALTEAILHGRVEREDIFVTSKLWGSDHHDPVSALKQTLLNMGMEYVDMYLVHWPVKLKPWACYAVPKEEDFEELEMESTWAGMEKCLDMGMCRCIGVSNFSSKKTEHLLNFASVPPAVNQVEMHPMWRQSKLRETCASHRIHVSAYSPLGGPGNIWGSTAVVDNPIIQSIALKHKATPAQVALKWGLSKGSSVIVKSFNQNRMKENMGSFDLKLDDQDFNDIDSLEEWKIMRGEFLVNQTTSPYRTIQELWDDEI